MSDQLLGHIKLSIVRDERGQIVVSDDTTFCFGFGSDAQEALRGWAEDCYFRPASQATDNDASPLHKLGFSEQDRMTMD